MSNYCKWCGKPIDSYHSVNAGHANFCSNRCKSAYERDQEEKRNKERSDSSKSGGCGKTIGVLLAIIIVFAALSGLFSNSDKEDVNTSSTVQTNHSDVVQITEQPTPNSESITKTEPEPEVDPVSELEIDESAIGYKSEAETNTPAQSNKETVVFRTPNYTIKVSNYSGKSIFYYCWNKGKVMTDAPSLQLSDGRYDDVNDLFVFENDGGYVYYVGKDDEGKNYIEVCRNGQTLIREVEK